MTAAVTTCYGQLLQCLTGCTSKAIVLSIGYGPSVQAPQTETEWRLVCPDKGPQRQKTHKISLETTDPIKATTRASQALEELKAMAMGHTPKRWRADQPVEVWDISTKADGSNDYDNAVAKTVTWGEIAEPEQIKELDLYDLMREADKRRKRRTGTGYSEGWRKNIENSIKTCPFGPMEATPRRIRDWAGWMSFRPRRDSRARPSRQESALCPLCSVPVSSQVCCQDTPTPSLKLTTEVSKTATSTQLLSLTTGGCSARHLVGHMSKH